MEEKSSSLKRTARIAGFLYLIVAITGGFSMMYVPALIVSGDAAATVKNIMTSESVFRLGVASALTCQVTFVFLVLELFELLKGVNRKLALMMVALVIAAVPIACLNVLNQFAVLVLLGGADYLTQFTADQLNSTVMFFLDLNTHGIFIAEIFWGLWLLPFGWLVIRSRFIPRIFGMLLLLGGCGYVVNFLVHIIFPGYEQTVSAITSLPLAISEISMVFWLMIKGVKNSQPETSVVI
jgi:hypothetical protein